MSLLLEALKQAAEAKKGAAPENKALDESGLTPPPDTPEKPDSTDVSGLELEPQEELSIEPLEEAGDHDLEPFNPSSDENESSEASYSDDALAIESTPVTPEGHETENTSLEPEAEPEALDFEPSPAEPEEFADTVTESVVQEPDPVSDLEPSDEETEPDEQETEAEKPAPEIKDQQTNAKDRDTDDSRKPSPEKASILTKKNRKGNRKDSSRRKIFLALMALVLAIGIGGYLAWLYYLDQADNQYSRLQSLSRPPLITTPTPPKINLDDDLTGIDEQAQQPLEGTIPSSRTVATVENESTEDNAQTDAQTTPASSEPAVESELTTEKTAVASEEVPTLDSVLESSPLPVTTPAASAANETPAISIRRSKKGNRINDFVQNGYQSFVQGNLSQASAYYEKAALEDPSNINALFGLAAVAVANGETVTARRLYNRIHDLDPTNQDAIAALASLAPVQSDSSLQQITKLKLMIQQNPDLAAPYFALGIRYQERSEWSKARSAFSRADAIDPENPDILYNIAICYDQLNRSMEAYTWYQLALDAAKTRHPAFDVIELRLYLQQMENQAGITNE